MQKEFPKGLYFNPKTDRQPDFVIGKISIRKKEFTEWLAKQEVDENGYIRLEVLTGRNGAYVAVDNWQPKQPSTPADDPDWEALNL